MRTSPRALTRRKLAVTTIVPALALSSIVIVSTATPAAAAAVPNTGKLAGELAKQTLTWETCDFGSPSLNDRLNVPNVSCATVKVPQDWHDPANGKTWDIRISQAKNIDVKNPRYKGTIFVNPGGPGGSGLPWGAVMQERAVDLNPYYNYVGFDPRGVGQSSHATCEYTYDAASTDPYAEMKALGQTCSADPAVASINTEQTAYDMDFIRFLLKAPKLSYMGFSYGTWLGAWYEKVFGTKYGDRFLLDSSLDVTAPTLESAWDLQPIARDRQFSMHLMNWIARHDDEFGYGTDPVAIYNRYFAAAANLEPVFILLIWLLSGGTGAFSNNALYPQAADAVDGVIIIGERDAAASATDLPIANAAKVAQAQRVLATVPTKKQVAANARKSASLSRIASSEAAAEMVTETLDSVFTFVQCNDGQWTQGGAYWEKHYADQSKKAPFSAHWGLLSGVSECAYWRTSNLMPVANAKTFPPTVVVQAELDSQTGWEGGYASGTKLPNTSLIAIDNEGSHGQFPYGTEGVDRPIINFFLNGKLPKKISVNQALPLPQEDVTYESWAKLNNKARHVVAANTNPFLPATTTPKRLAVSTVGDRELVAAADDQLLRQQVQRLYGSAGIKALQDAGLLTK